MTPIAARARSVATAYGNVRGLTTVLLVGSINRCVSQKTIKETRKREPANTSSPFPACETFFNA